MRGTRGRQQVVSHKESTLLNVLIDKAVEEAKRTELENRKLPNVPTDIHSYHTFLSVLESPGIIKHIISTQHGSPTKFNDCIQHHGNRHTRPPKASISSRPCSSSSHESICYIVGDLEMEWKWMGE